MSINTKTKPTKARKLPSVEQICLFYYISVQTNRIIAYKNYFTLGFIVGERAKTIEYRFCEVMAPKQRKKDKSLGFCPF
jgi:hypothetical protein